MKRPNSAVKQQRKDSPALQHRGAGPAGRGQAKSDRPGVRDARGTKPKDDKVRLKLLTGRIDEWDELTKLSLLFFHQGKKGSGDAQEQDQKKFDGTGHDSDLVDSLERDIVSRNPNVHW